MFRLPVSTKNLQQRSWVRMKSSSGYIRNTFIDYFVTSHSHKHVKSSSVVPFHDPTVPFVNAGMNQFKGVFLGTVTPQCARAVNSQKCIRVGGKHNDLDIVGTDGHHHTFFEMLGNWSFGDYYKKEACKMAWDLLLGPYRLKPDRLLVTYFNGDPTLNLIEDRECRDIWKDIGVSKDRIQGKGATDNFWEMGATGPCGPCTEIHYINDNETLTEIWNLVFIQCNRESDNKVRPLNNYHVDTGLGLERLCTLLQGVPTNYDTDLFQPLIRAIKQNSTRTPAYEGKYCADAILDCAYRRLADHARMVAICLADGAFPATSLNLKQIMRKSFKISSDVFKNPKLLRVLYDEVGETLSEAYPELATKRNDALLIIDHEEESYAKLRKELGKQWKDLEMQYPEVSNLSGVEMAGFARGYKEFKETMSKQNSNEIPGELVFKLYDTYGFQEDLIKSIASLNNMQIDAKGFWKLLSQHRSRRKTSLKEQSANNGILLDQTVKELLAKGHKCTNDQHKYNYSIENNILIIPSLQTELIAVLNHELEWIDHLDPCKSKPYYLVTEDTNFYCEEGGQIADSGIIRLKENVTLKVDSVFKIRDFVFHKGHFQLTDSEKNYISCGIDVNIEIDAEKRLKAMRNHTSVHLLNAAIRKVLPNSVVYQIGSGVTDKGLNLNLSVYGEKLSQKVILEAQELIRQSIQSNSQVTTRVIDCIEMNNEPSLLTVPGETYPDTGLRLVAIEHPLMSKELCCGTHVPATGAIEDFCITLVKGAGGHTPSIQAVTGDTCKEIRELFCHAEKLHQVIDLVNANRKSNEVDLIKSSLAELIGTGGAPYGEYKKCLELLEVLQNRAHTENDIALQTVAQAEIEEAITTAAEQGNQFTVHFVRCSYLMQESTLEEALLTPVQTPCLLLGCAQGVIVGVCRVPEEQVSSSFTATQWLSSMLPVFGARLKPGATSEKALMTPTKVSLINCEQLVQDAMQVAIEYAQTHGKSHDDEHSNTKDRRKN